MCILGGRAVNKRLAALEMNKGATKRIAALTDKIHALEATLLDMEGVAIRRVDAEGFHLPDMAQHVYARKVQIGNYVFPILMTEFEPSTSTTDQSDEVSTEN